MKKNPFRLQWLKKLTENWTICCALLFGILPFIYSPQKPLALALPDCSTIIGTAYPGGSDHPNAGDCLFFSPLPLCKTIPTPGYNIAADAILSNSTVAQHRVNCADLSDLPLCSQLTGNPTTALPGKNCAKECSEIPNQTGVRGADYAVHNRDCIRFHDAPEVGFTIPLVLNGNSVGRDCHKLPYDVNYPINTVDPNPGTNCNLLDCNNLTPDELNQPKFSDTTTVSYSCSGLTRNASCDTSGAGSVCDGSNKCYATVYKKYCDGSSVKCYDFTTAQLPYVHLRSSGSMCQLHSCTASSPTCIPSNDPLNISNRDGTGDANTTFNTTFTRTYKHFIMGFGTSSNPASDATLDSYNLNSLCTQVICKPIVRPQYSCTTNGTTISSDSSLNIQPHSSCDSTGPGSSCTTHFCYKTIDCNLPINSSVPECAIENNSNAPLDNTNSWFYRPKPNSKSLEGANNLIRAAITSDLCFSRDGFENSVDSNGNEFGYTTWLFNDFFTNYLSYDTRSPGVCGGGSGGGRGVGLSYLCGVRDIASTVPNDEAAFFNGYPTTEYTQTQGKHQVTVCLRYNNWMIPQKTCGSRECGVTCFFGCGAGGSNVCVSDVCRTLTVYDTETKKCDIAQNILLTTNDAPGNGDGIGDAAAPRCSARFGGGSSMDAYIRVRAVKYSKQRICAFLDINGVFAYNKAFYDGTETLSDGTCLSGTKVGTSCVGSADSNQSRGLAGSVPYPQWRVVRRIPYIKSNRPSAAQDEPQGYLNQDGRLFAEQECVKVPYRVTQNRMYNLATLANSSRLFVPPISISNAYKKKGGIVSTAENGESYGNTDFHYPEIEVRFGADSTKFNLDFGCIGDETTGSCFANAATNNVKSLTTTVNGATYTVSLMAKKELNKSNNAPLFCLYQKTLDVNGAPLSPIRLACVNRNLPEIDNTSSVDPTINLDKVLVSEDPANLYNDANLVLKYLNTGANRINNNCSGDDICSTALSLSNPDSTVPSCSNSNLEKYQICVQRSACSALNIECVQNGINRQAAIIGGNSTLAFDAIEANCKGNLLASCNRLKGITSTATSGDTNAYGWFNELCVTSGFETKLKQVIAYIPDNKTIQGKCIIDTVHATPNSSNSYCSKGGKAPECPCLEAGADSEANLAANQVIRTQTLREAGLCIDIPLPKSCAEINYNTSPNSDASDLNYVSSSLNQTRYCTPSITTNCVNASHQSRTNGATHAQFPTTPIGMVGLTGDCVGFWRNAVNASGVSLAPKINCSLGSDNQAHWGFVTNECIRYYCPAVTTNGPDINGNYENQYSSSETGENKGLAHGFATWGSYVKTDDFLEDVDANLCIPGFKKAGDHAFAGSTNLNTSQAAINAAIAGTITSYSGGTAPDRNCNQLGQWQTPNNACQRITCPTISIAAGTLHIPSSSSDNANWTSWNASGGAEFKAINASRSTSRIQPESYATGTCNNSLGFFQIGATPPTRGCNALGNWETNVVNPCQVGCIDIASTVMASNPNNGYSFWTAVNSLPSGQTEVDQTSTQCVSGYVPYPYPPSKDKYGNALSSAVANDLTRAASYPQRVCKQYTTAAGSLVNLWTAPSSSCINTCPGATSDPRIGVGITQHPTSTGTVSISWPNNIALGDTAYVYSPDAYTQQDASLYFNNRTNHAYILARHCGANGKWDDVIPQCSTNNGEIAGSHAVFNSPTNYIPVGSTTAAGTCTSTYYPQDDDTHMLPKYTCSYKDSNNRIDEVYYSLTANTYPCNHYCTAVEGQTFGNGSKYSQSVHQGTNNNVSNTSDLALVASGGRLDLTCKDNYGSAINIGSSVAISTPNQTCGGPNGGTTDRTASSPYVTCNVDGTWSSVYNDCSVCRSCNSISPIAGTTSGSAYVDCSSCCTDSGWTAWYDFTAQIQALSLSNLASTTLTQTGVDKRYCGWTARYHSGTVLKTVKCFDGTKYGQ